MVGSLSEISGSVACQAFQGDMRKRGNLLGPSALYLLYRLFLFSGLVFCEVAVETEIAFLFHKWLLLVTYILCIPESTYFFFFLHFCDCCFIHEIH